MSDVTSIADHAGRGTPRSPGGSASWRFRARPEHVREVRSALREFARANGFDGALLDDVLLCGSEAVTNAVIHAYVDQPPGWVRVSASLGAGTLVVEVADDGRGMQPRPDSPGLGLGLPTIGRLADEVSVRHGDDEGGTTLRMAFALDRRSALAEDGERTG
jgi:serine/threonine-protein kinase RsbW/stage II sporulation protein AB (anti-sigma F factor)